MRLCLGSTGAQGGLEDTAASKPRWGFCCRSTPTAVSPSEGTSRSICILGNGRLLERNGGRVKTISFSELIHCNHPAAKETRQCLQVKNVLAPRRSSLISKRKIGQTFYSEAPAPARWQWVTKLLNAMQLLCHGQSQSWSDTLSSCAGSHLGPEATVAAIKEVKQFRQLDNKHTRRISW